VRKGTFEEVTWEDVRDAVRGVAPVLADLIDNINPDKHFPLYVARYPFGSHILDLGHINIPTSRGKIVDIEDPAIGQQLRTRLHTTGMNAVGMILENAAELYIPMQEGIIPFALMHPGHIFGLWRALDPQPKISFHARYIWSMTAGARALFMLPKISDHSGQRRLNREFGLHHLAPKHMQDHWRIFADIAAHRHFPEPWYVSILFFSDAWFQQRDDTAWFNFRNYLLECAWRYTHFWRNKYIWDFIFSCIQASQNLKPNPYVMDTVKHILMMANGVVSGFGVASSDSVGPINALQQVYRDVYQLKHYAPLIFHSKCFERTLGHAVYYSLQYPTSLEFSPKSRSLASAMENLREVKYVLESVLKEVVHGTLYLRDTPLYNLLDKVNFDYFHSDVDPYHDIRLSHEIPDEDATVF